jgi:hypothetical protein
MWPANILAPTLPSSSNYRPCRSHSAHESTAALVLSALRRRSGRYWESKETVGQHGFLGNPALPRPRNRDDLGSLLAAPRAAHPGREPAERYPPADESGESLRLNFTFQRDFTFQRVKSVAIPRA